MILRESVCILCDGVLKGFVRISVFEKVYFGLEWGERRGLRYFFFRTGEFSCVGLGFF